MSFLFVPLDARLASCELPDYTVATLAEATERSEPDGVWLRLFGRDAEGQSVAVEYRLDDGALTLFFAHESADASALLSELCERASFSERHAARLAEACSVDEGRAQLFFGYKQTPGAALVPMQQRFLAVHCVELRTFHVLRNAARRALNDAPLACGARPIGVSLTPLNEVLDRLGISIGHALRVDGSDVPNCSAAQRTVRASRLEPDDATVPVDLCVAAFDLECQGARLPSGKHAFPNPDNPFDEIRCLAVTLARASEPETRRHFFLHTGPPTLCPAHVVAADTDDELRGASVEVRGFADERGLLAGFATLVRDELHIDDAPHTGASRHLRPIPPGLTEGGITTEYNSHQGARHRRPSITLKVTEIR